MLEKKLIKLSKKELIEKYVAMKGVATKSQIRTNGLRLQVSLMRSRLMKISNVIDYILEHPYSMKIGGGYKQNTKKK